MCIFCLSIILLLIKLSLDLMYYIILKELDTIKKERYKCIIIGH